MGLSLDEQSRARGMYVVGKTGAGKSSFLLNLIWQDMERGMGLAVLEPAGDLIDDVLARVPPERRKDVVVLDAADEEYAFGLNIFDCPNPNSAIARQQTADVVLQTFKKLFGSSWGYQMENIIRNITFTLIANPGTTMADIYPLLFDDAVRRRLVATVQSPAVRSFWQRYEAIKDKGDFTNSTLNKIDPFLANEMVARIVCRPTSVPIARAMDEGKILLLKLSLPQLGEDVVRLLGTTVVGQLLVGAFARATQEREERRPFVLYCDECHLFTNDFFATILTQTRKYGLWPVLAHQYRNQLDGQMHDAVLNAATYCLFQLTAPDARAFAPELHVEVPVEEEEQYEEDEVVPPPAPKIPRDVVQALLDDGHQDAGAQEIINYQLQELALAAANTQTGGDFTPCRYLAGNDTAFTYTRQSLKEGLNLLNIYYRGVLTGDHAPLGATGINWLLRVAEALRGWLCLSPELVYEDAYKRPGSLEQRITENILYGRPKIPKILVPSPFPDATRSMVDATLRDFAKGGSGVSIDFDGDITQFAQLGRLLQRMPIPQYARRNTWAPPPKKENIQRPLAAGTRTLTPAEIANRLMNLPPRTFAVKQPGAAMTQLARTPDVPPADRTMAKQLREESRNRYCRPVGDLLSLPDEDDEPPAGAAMPEQPPQTPPRGPRNRRLT